MRFLMHKVYIVEAYFEDYDSSYWRVIGIFTDFSQAKEYRKKWKKFYKKSKSIFSQPKDYTPNIYKNYGEETYEDWTETEEYYRLISQYPDINLFSDISIREFVSNTDILIDNSKRDITPQMLTLMIQWDRDYKLNKLTE